MSGGKIVRTVGGESVKTAKKSITLTATEGDLTFNSPTQVIMNGKQGGVQYLNNYVPPPPLRVLKLDGPFDEKGQKVSVLKKEEWYSYKVIQFNRDFKEYEIKGLKWATKYDDNELYINYPSVIGKKEVSFKIPKNRIALKFTVYAYLEKPIDEVCIETGIFEIKFPMLIIQSIGRKGKKTITVKGKKTSSNETAIDLLYNDYTENKAGFTKLRNQLRQEIYDTNKQERWFNITSRDNYADEKADKLIKKVENFSKKTDAELFEIFNNKAESFSQSKLEDNIKRMIAKMQRNEGGEYSHIDLTNAVIQHENTIKFVNEVKKYVVKYLKKYSSDISILEIKDDGTGIIYEDMVDSKKPKDEQVNKPRFNNYTDALSGIQIAINDVWAFQIYLSKYYMTNNDPHGELYFNFYDHFGLDYPDIEKYDYDIFIAWFILQHFRGYKPFITKVSFTSKF